MSSPGSPSAPDPRDAVAVTCRGLTKTYGRGHRAVCALRGIDLDIDKGAVFFLVGPSGCGKTTLISIMSGLLDGDDGECVVLGQPMHDLRGAARADFRSQAVGFVFQAFNLLPGLTAKENVAVPLIISGRPRISAISRAEEALDAVGLAARRTKHPTQLSTGEQQRVAIARALVHEPKLIVCDEPTSALDHTTGLKVMELMSGLARRTGCTLIVVTHDERILPYADHIAKMDDGRVVHVAKAANRGRL